jgi:hypothetical protein
MMTVGSLIEKLKEFDEGELILFRSNNGKWITYSNVNIEINKDNFTVNIIEEWSF